jgi:tetratricopeptide (TPR) repeat protein
VSIKSHRAPRRWRWIVPLVIALPLHVALGQGSRLALDAQERAIIAEMQRRGNPSGEIYLAVAALYARANVSGLMFQALSKAREHGCNATSAELLLGRWYRTQGQYDRAFRLLANILVRHPDQPRALVELWMALYQQKLQRAIVQTDVDPLIDRLAAAGLFFPRGFGLSARVKAAGGKVTAAGYNALLVGNDSRFAAELFREAISINPSDAKAHRGLAIARTRQHDFKRAAGAYLLYLELSPDAPDADQVDKALMRYWKERR